MNRTLCASLFVIFVIYLIYQAVNTPDILNVQPFQGQEITVLASLA